MRFLGYTLADPAIPIPPPTQEDMAKMGAFIEEATKAGVLVATGGLGPPSEAVKVSYRDGEFTVLDGPFTEAKELVGGWALLECRDKAEAIEWTKRFLSVAGDGESTIRPVYGG
ncbi:MAG: transcriptional regulator [Streptosporangiaceae bacterium]|nr:transcriptional regulator [Streptosporangiaceae bacterium]